MKYRPPTILLALAIGAVSWLLTPHKLEVAARSAPDKSSGQTAAQQISATAPRSESADETSGAAATVASGPVLPQPKPASLAAVAEPPEGPEVGPGLTPITVMENMRAVFRQYSVRFGGNPVGVNKDITAALNGGNSRQVVFINTEDGLRINEQGQLVDNWGTPFFFHQLSRTEMEIHSAGPDRKMWTADDLVIK
jgi:hypothetical protein